MPAELTYFNLRGVAEGARLLYAAAGKSGEFTDNRIPVDVSKFSEGVAVAAPQFAEGREAGTFKMNMNRVPILVVDGATIGQSSAIERYIARQLGMYGSTDIEGALIDMIAEHIKDISKSYQDEKKKGPEAAATWLKDSLPEWLGKLEATLGSEGFAVGNKMSWADIKLFQFMREYFDDKESVATAEATVPKVSAIVKAVESCEGVKLYLETRPATPF